MANSVYDFTADTINGTSKSIGEYKGKVLLIVNTASKCRFTPQYESLEKLHQTYKDKDVTVLGFPCNQFGHQEQGDESQISEFCQMNYGVSFPMFSKIDVNGQQQHPLFRHLKSQAPGVLGSKAIKWNFTKFLVDQSGVVLDRFAPTTPPEKIEDRIKKLLG